MQHCITINKTTLRPNGKMLITNNQINYVPLLQIKSLSVLKDFKISLNCQKGDEFSFALVKGDCVNENSFNDLKIKSENFEYLTFEEILKIEDFSINQPKIYENFCVGVEGIIPHIDIDKELNLQTNECLYLLINPLGSYCTFWGSLLFKSVKQSAYLINS